MIVETWNIFHGRPVHPGRRLYVKEAVQLATAAKPDVLCLQEVPAWALGRLGSWTPYTALPALAARPTIGPFPSAAELGRRLTSLNPGLLRSAFSGQGNAMLLAPPYRVLEQHLLGLNPRSFRRSQARWLGLGLRARLAWAKDRRVCQVARVRDGTRTFVVANMHATSYPDRRLADAELLRALTYVDGLAQPAEPVIFGGDFNITVDDSHTLQDAAKEWGFSNAGPGIDHVLVRGLQIVSGPTMVQYDLNGVQLSDHGGVRVVVR